MAFLILICLGGGIFLFWSGLQNQPIKDTFTKAVRGSAKVSTEVQPTHPQ